MKNLVIAGLLLLSAQIAPVFAGVQRTNLISQHGEASVIIYGGDYIDARQRAKDAAMHDAIRKAVVALSSADQTENNAGAITTAIMQNAIDFTHSYKFNEEKIDPENHAYVVSLEVTFFSDNISNALEKIGLKVAERPKAVVIVDEQTMGAISASSFLLSASPTENMLKEMLEDNGFKGITRAKLRALKNDAEVEKAMKGDAAALKWLAGQYEAKIVMIGSAGATEAGGKITGTVLLKIYEGKSAELLWTKEAAESIESTNHTDKFKTIRTAAEKIRDLTAAFLNEPPPAKKEAN